MQSSKEKSNAMALASFIFGLAFWIPLLNLIFCALAVYLGIKSLVKIKKNPEDFGGKAYAVIGIILGIIVYVAYFTGVGMCFAGYKEICKNIGLGFLS